MKNLALAVVLALGLGAVACSNPCKKLAKAVCSKAKDDQICKKYQEQAKRAGKAEKKQCKAQLKNVEAVVMAEKLKSGAKSFLKGLGQKLMGGLKDLAGEKKPPTKGATPAPAKPAPQPQ